MVFPDDNILHLSPRDGIKGTLCPKQSDSSLPKLMYLLRQCMIYLKYTVPNYRSSSIRVAQTIKFINTLCSPHVTFME